MPDETPRLPPEMVEATRGAVSQPDRLVEREEFALDVDEPMADWTTRAVCVALAPLLAERDAALERVREAGRVVAEDAARRQLVMERRIRALRDGLETARDLLADGRLHLAEMAVLRALAASSVTEPEQDEDRVTMVYESADLSEMLTREAAAADGRSVGEPEQQEVLIGGDVLVASPADLAEDVSRAHGVLDEMGAPQNDAHNPNGLGGAVYSLSGRLRQLRARNAAPSSSSEEGERANEAARTGGERWMGEDARRAYEAGRHARTQKREPVECPFTADHLYDAWHDGWMRMDEQIKAHAEVASPSPSLRELLTSDKAVRAAADRLSDLAQADDEQILAALEDEDWLTHQAREVLAAVADTLTGEEGAGA